MIRDFAQKPSIEFISTVNGLPGECLPYPSKRKLPKWIRSNENFDNSQPTIKKCPGILDYAGIGYIVPLWADLKIDYDSSLMMLNPEFSVPWANALLHSKEQFQGTPLESLSYPYSKVIKIEAPWRIKLTSGYSSLLVDPIYHDVHSSITVIPGCIDHDAFHTANIFVSFNLYGKGTVLIPRGTPLYQVLPFRRSVFSFSIRTQTAEDSINSAREGNTLGTFNKRYWRYFWQKK